MLTSDKMVTLSADMRAYLEYEAKRRGIDIAVVYEEEIANRKLFNQEPFSINELKALATGSRPDPRLLEGDEECPF